MTRRRALSTACSLALLGLVPQAHAALPGTTERLSIPTGFGSLPADDGDSSTSGDQISGGDHYEVASADGRYIAFTSKADGLAAGIAAVNNVALRRDRTTGATDVASRAPDGRIVRGYATSISDDGNRVVFVTNDQLVAADDNDDSDVYVRDLAAGTTILASQGTSGVGSDDSFDGAISGDGTKVAFTTGSPDLLALDNDSLADVYLRDLVAGTLSVVSVSAGGNDAADAAEHPSVNLTGSVVAFATSSALVPGDTNGTYDVYARVNGSTTELVSAANGTTATEPATGQSFAPSVSSDGRYVAFTSSAADLVASPADTNATNDVFRRDRQGPGFQTLLISRNATDEGDEQSVEPMISTDGTRIAFSSEADNLDGADSNQQVFVTTVGSNTATMVSRSAAPAFFGAGAPAIGGSVVAFTSYYNLGPAVSPDWLHVFARAGTGPIELVSAVDGGGPPSGQLNDSQSSSRGRMMSDDGRYVVFASASDGLHPGPDDDPFFHVFRRDTLTGETVLVDRVPGGAIANGQSFDATISADGSRVAFTSTASNLDPADTTFQAHTFVRDFTAGTVTLASRTAGGGLPNTTAISPMISADGRRVSFETQATNMGDGDVSASLDVHVRDLAAGTTLWASRTAAGAQPNAVSRSATLDGTGTLVAFETDATNMGDGDTTAITDIHLRDLSAGTTTWISQPPGGGQATDDSNQPHLSDDGRRISFETRHPFAPGDTNAPSKEDVYVRDVGGAFTRVSLGPGGEQPTGPFYRNAISGDGSTVAFDSEAVELRAGDTPETVEVYARRVADPPSGLVHVSRADGASGAPLTESGRPTLNRDGSCVAFESRDPDAVPGPGATSDFSQVYRRILRDECPQAAPETTLDGPATTGAATPTFTVGASEPGSTFECRVDAGAFAPCGTAFTTPPLTLGAHTVEARATDPSGRVDGTPASRAVTVLDVAAPGLTNVRMANKRFRRTAKRTATSAAKRKAARKGTAFRFTLSEVATVRIVLERKVKGRRVGKSCRKATAKLRKRKSCTRYEARGSITRKSLKAGARSIAFSGRLGKKSLPLGSYRATLVATDAAGNRSAARRVTFTIVRK